MKKLLIAVLAVLLAVPPASFAAPPHGPPSAFYYAGGKKHFLHEDPEWIAIEAEDEATMDSVEREFKNTNVADASKASVQHGNTRIVAMRLSEPGNGKAKAKEMIGRVKGAKRNARVFKNGKLDPMIETEEFLISFELHVPRAEIQKLLAKNNAEIVRPLGNYAPNGFVARVKNANKDSAIDVANTLYGQPGVEYAHPNLIAPKQHRFVPNDPIYPSQWHLNNNGTNGFLRGADIKAQRAWDITRGHSDVTIAILDDGVDTGHEDFGPGKFVGNWDFVGNDSDPRPGTGQHHGTACAGLAAASGNNGIGVSGVAPNSRIMAVRMLGPGHTWEREAAAIAHAKNNGAWIISNSWGPEDGTGETVPCPDVVNNAIVDATTNGRGGKGCVIVWAAGNGNESVDLDGYASHPRVICVAATMSNDTAAQYSDFGNAIHVAAPGGSGAGDMVTTDRTGSVGYSTTSYANDFNGTSAATPVVSGTVGLLLAAEPNLTWQQVRQRLIDSADFVDTANATYDENGHHPWYGFGRINAWQALVWNDDTAPSVTIGVPANNLVTDNLAAADGTATDVGVGLLRVEVKLRQVQSDVWWNWTAAGFGWADEHPNYYTNATLSGSTWSIALPTTLSQGLFELHVRAEDKAGQFSSWVVRQFTLDNQGPTVTINTPETGHSYTSLAQASGTASDVSSGVSFVRVALFDQTDSRWWNWNGNAWGGTTFDWATNVRNANGTTSWTIGLPTLPEGNYQVHAQSVDTANKASGWVSSTYTLDNGNPTIAFAPLVNQANVFDLGRLGGTISEPGTVVLRIAEYNVGGTDRYWNGSAWVLDANTWVPGWTSGLAWGPNITLPRRSQMRPGHYMIDATIVDRAGKQGTLNLVVIRTAQDTTLPDLSITTPAEGQTFTNNVLPAFHGMAYDAESGIASVDMYLMRLVAGGYEYWNGRGWSTTPATLSAETNFDSWQAPVTSGNTAYSLPSGANLRNGTYQLQLTAKNKEEPAGTRGVSRNFVVDYHPVYTWTAGSFSDNDGNNDNHFWNNPENWNPYGVPPAEAIVVINSGQPTAAHISNVNVYGINLNGGTLAVANLHVRKLNMAPSSRINGGNLTLEATNGVFNWTGGVLAGTYNFEVSSVVNMSGSAAKELNSFAVVNNRGTVNWSGSGTIYTYAYNTGEISTFNNLSNGVFNVLTDGQVFSHSYNPSQFVNQPGALFTKTGGTNETQINSFFYFNRGETRAETGTLAFNGDLRMEDGGVFSGSGSGKFAVPAGRTEIRGTTVLVDTEFGITGGRFVGMSNALLVTVGSGAFDWSTGIFDGAIQLAGDSTLRMSGPGRKELNSFARLYNSGNIVWSGNGDIYNYAYNTGEYSVIENYPGSTFTMTGDGVVHYTYNPSSFIVHPGATVSKTGGSGSTRFDWYFNNNGTAEGLAGTLRLNGGGNSEGTWSVSAGGTINFTDGTQTWKDGTTVKGAGKIVISGGSVNRSGSVFAEGPGTATIELVNGTFGGSGSVDGDLQLNWLGGAVGGVLDVGPDVTVNASTSGTKTLHSGAVFNNSGIFNWSGSGKLYTYAYNEADRSIFNNLTEGVFNLLTDGDLFDTTYNRSFFTNHPGGLFAKTGGTGTNTINDFGFENFGEIKIETGAIQVTDIAKLGAGSVLTGSGAWQVNGNVTLDAALAASGPFEVLNGTLSCTTNSSYLGNGPFNWTGGGISGQFTLASGATMNLSGNANKSLNNFATFDNRGVVNWAGPGRLYTYAYNSADIARFNNHSNGVFNITTDGAVFEITYNPSVFTNHAGGLVVKSGGGGTNQINSYHFHNYGEVRTETGTLWLTDAFSFNDGSKVTGSGTLRWAGAGILRGNVHSSGNAILDGGSVTGVIVSNVVPTLSGPGPFGWQAGVIAGTLNLQNGSTMDLFGSASKQLNNFAVLNNYGVMNWSGSGRIYTHAYNQGDSSYLNNHGTFNLLSDGPLFLTEYNRSFFTNHVDGIFRKSGGTNSTVVSAFLLSNRGQIDIATGALELTDLAELHTGSVTGTGTLLVNGGQTVVRGAVEVNGPTFRIGNGNLHTAAGVGASITTKNDSVLKWQGGSLSGAFVLTAGSSMEMSGDTKHIGDPGPFNNYGNILWTQGDMYRNAYYLEERSTFYNRSGATFTVTGNPNMTYSYNPSKFVNEAGATVRRTASNGTTRFDWIVENAGTLDLRSGTLEFATSPSLQASSVVTSTITSTNAGTFGRLHLAGNIPLVGQLQVLSTNGFAPAEGFAFTPVTYGGRSSEFSSIELPTLGYPLQWKTTYGGSALTLTVEKAHLLELPNQPVNGQLTLNFSGPAAAFAVLQTSTNLIHWVDVATNTPFTGTFQFTDFDALTTNKFYKVLITP